jgi:hypothetical protein
MFMRFRAIVSRFTIPSIIAFSSLYCVAQTPASPQAPAADQTAAADPSEPTAAEQKTCDAHNLPIGTCRSLVLEYHQQNLRQQITGGKTPETAVYGPLDNVLGDLPSVTSALQSRATVMVLSSDLKTQFEPLAQAALQQILTGAAITQIGAQPTAGGATNLVTKPTTTDLISVASESGAFTDTSNGSSMTIQANPLGLAKVLSNTPLYKRVSSTAADWVQPLNFSVVLNVAQASTSATPTSGSANTSTPPISSVLIPSNNASFSSFTASYNVYRRYNPQSKVFETKWREALDANKANLTSLHQAIARDVNALVAKLAAAGPPAQILAARATFHKDAAVAETQGTDGFEALIVAYMPYWEANLQEIVPDKQSAAALLNLSNDLEAYHRAAYAVLNEARGTLATISYVYTDNGQKPATHDITGSLSYVFKGNAKKVEDTGRGSFASGLQITANVTTSIYAHLPADATYGRLRDFQASAEIDKRLGGTTDAPRAVLSAAGYGQYQFDPTVLNITSGNLAPGTGIVLPSSAQVLLGTSGWLGVVQGKLAINLTKELSIPVAVKWSNKTDLLQANDVRGQFGLSYDLSPLKSLLSIGNK